MTTPEAATNSHVEVARMLRSTTRPDLIGLLVGLNLSRAQATPRQHRRHTKRLLLAEAKEAVGRLSEAEAAAVAKVIRQHLAGG